MPSMLLVATALLQRIRKYRIVRHTHRPLHAAIGAGEDDAADDGTVGLRQDGVGGLAVLALRYASVPIDTRFTGR